MGAYLDRLNAEYDEAITGIDTVIDRAAEEKRDVSDDENKSVERARERLGVLKAEIERYTAIEKDQAAVTALRANAPAPRTTAVKVSEPVYDIAREFPTPAHYAITVHRATALRDPAAREALERLDRATAHQTTLDNPGLIPLTVLGPVLNFLSTSRAFVNSITNRPLPSGKFDRPVITQHVAVDKQPAEKDLTASQKMVVGSLPATAATYAGHLNISRQDIKWSSPSILQIVFDDFAAIYANVTDADACAQFLADMAAPVEIASATAADINKAVYSAAQNSLTTAGVFPDTMWVSPDVWGLMGSMVTSLDTPLFPSLSVTGQSGNPLGLRLVVDPNFAAQTMVVGPSRFAEWYEDVDGLMQVGEPDVLGQLVGYAGYAAFVNVNPDAFTAFTPPAPVEGTRTAASTPAKSSTTTSK